MMSMRRLILLQCLATAVICGVVAFVVGSVFDASKRAMQERCALGLSVITSRVDSVRYATETTACVGTTLPQVTPPKSK